MHAVSQNDWTSGEMQSVFLVKQEITCVIYRNISRGSDVSTATRPLYLPFAVPYKIYRNAFQGVRNISVTREGNTVSANLGS